MIGIIVVVCVPGILFLTVAGQAETPPRVGEKPQQVSRDFHGDPLPAGAAARLGSIRLGLRHSPKLVAFSPDGKTIATGGDDTVRMWDATTGKQLRGLPLFGDGVWCLAFDPTGTKLATSGNEFIRVRDPATGKVIGRMAQPPLADLRGMTFLDGGKTLFFATRSGDRYSWRFPDFEITWKRGSPGEEYFGVSFSNDGRLLVAITRLLRLGENATGIKVLQIPEGKIIAEIKTRDENRRSPKIDDIIAILSPDRKIVATCEAVTDGNPWYNRFAVRLREAATGKELLKLLGRMGVVHALAFSPDGRLLASAHGMFRGSAHPRESVAILWDVTTGKELARMEGHGSDVTCLAFSPDGTRLATGSADGTALIWDVRRVLTRGKTLKRDAR